MSEVADLYVTLRAIGTQFEEGMGRAGVAAGEADGKIAAVSAGVRAMSLAMGGAALLVAGAALKMSSEFDRSMELLHTLAHVPESSLKSLSDGVLKVAGDVGFAPNSLAEALYHVESSFASTGISGKKALEILRIASEGAQIGGANLVDVQNALDAAVVSGIPGVQNMQQAMGALLATVGSGDMTMQDFADAAGTGVLAIAKIYGLSLKDVGAALATFGDNNIRGAKAGTDLRMSIMDLTKQAAPGQAALEKIGIATNQLARDMQTGGLNKAMKDLHEHLVAAGDGGKKMGAELADAFTKKSSAPLAILLSQFDRLESKYPELDKGSGSFADSWARTAALVSTKAKMAKANIEVAFVGIGHALTPIAGDILSAFNHAFDWAKTHQKDIKEIGNVIKTFLVGALILASGYLASMAIEAAIAAAPFIALALAIGLIAKALMNLYEHNAKVREFVQEIVTGFKKDATEAIHWLVGAFQEAKKIVGEVIASIMSFYDDHQAAINKMVTDVVSILQQLWQTFQAAFQVIQAIVQTAVKIITDLWDRFGTHIWQHVVTAWNAVVQITRGAFDVIKGIFEVVTGILTGKWSKVWKGLQDIVNGVWNVISGVVKAALNLLSTIIGAGMAVISAAWGLVWHAIETMAKSAWNGIQAVGRLLFDWFIRLPINILDKIGHAAEWLYNTGKNIITGLYNGVLSSINMLWQWAQGLPNDLFKILNGLYQWMLVVGENIITGIWNGIAGMADWLYNKVMNFAKGIWHSVTSFLGIGSPSKLMKDTVGKHIVTGIAAGILENQHLAYNAMQTLATNLTNTKINLGKYGSGSGFLANGLATQLGGNLGSNAVRNGSGGDTYIQVTVQGQLVDTQGFFKAMQTAAQQHGARNSSVGLAFSR